MCDLNPVELAVIELQNKGDWPALCRCFWALDGAKRDGISSPLSKAAGIMHSIADSRPALKPIAEWLTAASHHIPALLDPPPINRDEFNEEEFFSLKFLAAAKIFLMLHEARTLGSDTRSQWLRKAEDLAEASRSVDTTSTALIHSLIGTYHGSLGNFSSTLDSLSTAFDLIEAHPLGRDHPFRDFRAKLMFNLYLAKKRFNEVDASALLEGLISHLASLPPESTFVVPMVQSLSNDKTIRDRAIASLRSRWFVAADSPPTEDSAIQAAANLRRLGDICFTSDPPGAIDFYLKAINLLSPYRLSHRAPVLNQLGELKSLIGFVCIGTAEFNKSLYFSALARRDFKTCFRSNQFIDLTSCLRSGLAYLVSYTNLKPLDIQKNPIRFLDAFFSGISIFERRRIFTENPEDNSAIHLTARTVYHMYLATNLKFHETATNQQIYQAIAFRNLTAVEHSRSRCLFDLCHGNEELPPGLDQEIKSRYLATLVRLKAKRARLSGDVPVAKGTREPFTPIPQSGELIAKLGHPGGAPSPVRPKEENIPEAADQLRLAWQAVVAEIKSQYPDFSPDHPFHDFSEKSLAKLPRDLAVIHLCEVKGSPHPPYLLITSTDDVILKQIADTSFRTKISSWIRSYDDLKIRVNQVEAGENNSAPSSLRDFGDQSLQQLEHLFGDVLRGALEHLSPSIRKLVLCPDPLFAGIPIHAIPLSEEGALFERFEVSYSPSLTLYLSCSERPLTNSGRIVVACPPDPQLHFTRAEALGSWPHENANLLASESLDRTSILNAARDCEIFHYSGHCHFDSTSPLDSELHTFAADPLLLRDCFGDFNLSGCSLAILNGCETGMSLSARLEKESENLDKGLDGILDENLSFSTGFLAAGSRCILSTLWSVWDISSALLIWKFSQLYRSAELAGQTCLCLRNSINWLRSGIVSGPFLRDHVLPDFLRCLDAKNPADQRAAAYCQEIADKIAQQHPDSPPFSSPTFWAQYTISGCGWSP